MFGRERFERKVDSAQTPARFLSEEGFYAFHNWFDDRAWYPLGRIIGGTIYPGLMVTSAVFTYLLNLGMMTGEPCIYDVTSL